MKALAVRLTARLVLFVVMKNNICKVCALTLQGMENEGEDICVDCLADLCFPPSNNYNIKEGCIRQSTDNPINKERDNNDNTDKT
jgi:hypothetical protein